MGMFPAAKVFGAAGQASLPDVLADAALQLILKRPVMLSPISPAQWLLSKGYWL
jgi:hypothetical protein